MPEIRDLRADTAVTAEPRRPGHYTAHLTEHWNGLGPQGGVLMALAMRAMQAEIADSEFRPRSATVTFVNRVMAGPLRAEVEILRRSSSAVHARAAVNPSLGDGIGLEVIATFGRPREGPLWLDLAVPEFASPAQSRLPDAPSAAGASIPPARFFDQFDVRVALGRLPWETDETPADSARIVRWYRYKRDQRGPDGRMDPLALLPIADTMPPALWQTVDTEGKYVGPSLDLTVHFLEDTDTEWILSDARVAWTGESYARGENRLWAKDRLLAIASQMMVLRPRP
jgi:acyl-CoA thioesterase